MRREERPVEEREAAMSEPALEPRAASYARPYTVLPAALLHGLWLSGRLVPQTCRTIVHPKVLGIAHVT